MKSHSGRQAYGRVSGYCSHSCSQFFLRFFGDFIHGIDSHEELKLVFERFYPLLSPFEGSYEEGLYLLRRNLTINFFSGYLIEESLSIDNLFVIMAILKAFSVRKADYKRDPDPCVRYTGTDRRGRILG